MRKTLFRILICLVFSTAAADRVYAQIAPDGTMGTAGQIKGPVYDIKAEYGKQSGSNLFHSFGQFSIASGETADFRVSPAIQNIISRVTGGEISRIDGTLRSTLSGTSTISDANLYLLNPAGVIFGQNARLDIGGSFHVSTADYLRMGKDERFNAVADVESLSSAAPEAFGFSDSDIASISIEGRGEISQQDWEANPTGLRVKAGNTLSLIGGNIEIQNGTFYEDVKTGDIVAPEGRINMASVASPGEAILRDADMDISSFQKMGSITLSDNATVSVSGNRSGDIFIRSGEFFVYSGSSVEADMTGDENGGITDIQADTLSLNAGDIFSDTKGWGRGGDISLRISESATASNYSKIFADATGEGAEAGSAGSVFIEAENISLNESAVSSETYGKSSGGTVTLRARDSIDIFGSGQIFARSTGYMTDAAAGAGGTVLIETKKLSLSEKSLISTDTYKDGRGGNITVTGYGELPAESVHISSDSRIYAGTEGSGQGGTVLLETDSLSFIDKGKIDSESLSTDADAGTAGDIRITAENISLGNQGLITANTQGPGAAGSVIIDADRLELKNESEISSASISEKFGGNAGVISLRLRDSLSLSGNSTITTEAQDAGKGQIVMDIGDRIYLLDGKITTAVKGGGNDAGDISSDQRFLILNRGDIVANAYEGKGGNIRITADQCFVQSSGSLVDASSQLGIDGTVYIDAPDENVSKSLTVLPNNFLDAARWTSRPCSVRNEESRSRFVFSERDAVLSPLDDWLPAPALWFKDSSPLHRTE